MSMCATNPIGTCLREARRSAGLDSIIEAAKETNRSPESVGRHERGEVNLHPQDLIQYAGAYNRPDLLLRYCGECPIHHALYGTGPTDRELIWTALRLSNRLRQAADYADRLERIMDDGTVDKQELPDYEDAVAFLRSIETASRELLLQSMALGLIRPKGKEKDRTAGTVPARASIAR